MEPKQGRVKFAAVARAVQLGAHSTTAPTIAGDNNDDYGIDDDIIRPGVSSTNEFLKGTSFSIRPNDTIAFQENYHEEVNQQQQGHPSQDNVEPKPKKIHNIFRMSVFSRLKEEQRQEQPHQSPDGKNLDDTEGQHHNIHDTLVSQGRLEQFQVLELLKDGGKNYLELTVRGLHKHVLWCITQRLTSMDVAALKDRSDIPIRKTTTGIKSIKAAAAAIMSPPSNTAADYGTFIDGVKKAEGEIETIVFGAPERIEKKSKDTKQNEKDAKLYLLQSVLEEEDGVEAPKHDENEKDDDRNNQSSNRSGKKVERLGTYLHPRDMRRLVTPFSASNIPEVIVRRHVLLLNFDPLRTIILRDRLLVIVPHGADKLLDRLEKRLRSGAAADVNRILGRLSSNDQLHDPKNTAINGTNDGVISTEGKKLAQALDNDKKQTQSNDGEATKESTSTKSLTTSTSSVSLFDDNGEWDEIQNETNLDMSFELHCVDCVLQVVTGILMEDTYHIQMVANERMELCGYRIHNNRQKEKIKTLTSKGADPLKLIQNSKNAVSEMLTRVDRFNKSMQRILDRDEDLALMNVSHLITHPEYFVKPVNTNHINREIDEPQVILETHLQVGYTLENNINLLQGQLDTSTEHIGQKLDSLRNRLLFANMIISVVSLCVAAGSFVGSLLGMNVTNHIEESPTAFKTITWTTVLGSFLLGCTVMVILMLSGTVPTPGYVDD